MTIAPNMPIFGGRILEEKKLPQKPSLSFFEQLIITFIESLE